MDEIGKLREALAKLPVEVTEVPVSDEIRSTLKSGTPHRFIVTPTRRFQLYELAKATAECKAMVAEMFKSLDLHGRFSVKSVPEHKSKTFMLRINLYLFS